MKIQFLGTSHGFPEVDRYCSCNVITVNGKLYVIDAGLSLYSALLHNGYNPADVAGVFITHMHGDHASGLIEFIDILTWGKKDLNPSIQVPTLEGKLSMLQVVQAMDPGREVFVTVYAEGVIFEDENVKITAYRTRHGVATFGFLVEAEGKRVYFSGDMSRDISDAPLFLYEQETDLVVCECAHNCMPKIAERLNAMKTKKLIMNHVAPKHSLAEFEECKPLITDKPFLLAYDLMSVEL